MDSFRRDLGVTRALVRGNSKGSVEVSEKSFNQNRFVVSTNGWLKIEFKHGTNCLKVLLKMRASIRGNKETETHTEKHMLHESSSNGGRVNGWEVGNDGEAGKVAHGSKEVFGA